MRNQRANALRNISDHCSHVGGIVHKFERSSDECGTLSPRNNCFVASQGGRSTMVLEPDKLRLGSIDHSSSSLRAVYTADDDSSW